MPSPPAEAVAAVLPSVLADLERLVRIPSVSADPGAAHRLTESAELVADLLRGVGLDDVDILTVEGGRPAVLGRRAGPAGAQTVLLYAHHDVQPVGDEADWASPPFAPTQRGGRLYGRGTSDDKAGIALHVAALRALGDDLPVGVVVLVEGEEEVGSPTLARFLTTHRERLAADVVVIADASNWTPDVPALTTSLRGGAQVVVEVRTLDHAVHSGMYGGPTLDAVTALIRLLSTLHDETGGVAVAGLHARSTAAPPLAEEQFRVDAGVLDGVALIGTGTLTDRMWNQPSITVIGIDAPGVAGSSPTLQPVARAAVSLRVAPGEDPERARDALVAHLESKAPWGARVTVTPSGTAAPFTAAVGGSAYRAAHRALSAAWGVEAVDMGSGGSIPFIAAFAAALPHAQILITGVEDPDTRAHGPNESLHLAMFERCCVAEVLLLTELGATQG